MYLYQDEPQRTHRAKSITLALIAAVIIYGFGYYCGESKHREEHALVERILDNQERLIELQTNRGGQIRQYRREGF